MIATAAYILANGLEAAFSKDHNESVGDLLDVLMFMAFDLAMMTAYSAPKSWSEVFLGL